MDTFKQRASMWNGSTCFTTPMGIEGYLVKHRRIRDAWSNVDKLEGNYRRRWFILANGVLYYFQDQKTRERAQDTNEPLSKSAKGFIPLHAMELIECETKSGRDHSFVLQMTGRLDSVGKVTTATLLTPRARRECMLLIAPSEGDKEKWVAAIRQWQAQNLANVQDFEYYLSDDEDTKEPAGLDEGWTEFFTEEGTPYYMNNATRETTWAKPPTTPRSQAAAKRRTFTQRLTRGSFIVWARPLRAKNLASATTNPVCKVKFRGLEFQTGRSKNTDKSTEADWSDGGERFEFLVQLTDLQAVSSQDSSLHISVCSSGMVGGSEQVGTAVVPSKVLWEAFGGPMSSVVPLKNDGRLQGDVTVEFEMSLATATPADSMDMSQLSSSLFQSQFGVPVTSIVLEPSRTRNGVPRIFAETIETVRKQGMQEQGIFRHSGNKSDICRLRAFCNLNWEYNLESEDVHTVTGLLKLFLREMPEPLFPSFLYHNIIMIAGATLSGEQQQAHDLKILLSNATNLPQVHAKMMTVLFRLLSEISSHAEENLMHPKNLAVVIGPNIIRLSTNDDQAAFRDINQVQMATELFIKYFSYFFES